MGFCVFDHSERISYHQSYLFKVCDVLLSERSDCVLIVYDVESRWISVPYTQVALVKFPRIFPL